MVNGGANRPTVVVNRAYDYENNNAYLQKFVAHHSVPECRVEFVMNGLNDLKYSEEQRKRMVKTNTVQDVSDANGEKLQLMMMVENRGYDVLASPHTDESDLNQSKQSYQMECNSRHREKKPLTSSELLNFAKQISEGMVGQSTHCPFPFLNIRSFSRNFWQRARSCIEIWRPETCWFAQIKR